MTRPNGVVECYGRGHALPRSDLGPEYMPAEPVIPRDELPEWVFGTQTRFLVAAPTPELARRWFEEEDEVDVNCEILEFGQVQLLGQTVRSMHVEPEPRYGITDLGRRAVALEQLFGPWPTVADT
jgi:hypothetical protein